MKYLADTCVLFPTVMRTLLLEAAKLKNDEIFWSEKILSNGLHQQKNLANLVNYKPTLKFLF